MIYMFKKEMFEYKIYNIITPELEVGNFLPSNWPEWETSRFFPDIQFSWRQIGGVFFFKCAKVAFWRDVSLNFGAFQQCHKPGNIDLH